MESNKNVFPVLVPAEKQVKIFRPTSCLELKFPPIEINKLAISIFVKSYYLHNKPNTNTPYKNNKVPSDFVSDNNKKTSTYVKVFQQNMNYFYSDAFCCVQPEGIPLIPVVQEDILEFFSNVPDAAIPVTQ